MEQLTVVSTYNNLGVRYMVFKITIITYQINVKLDYVIEVMSKKENQSGLQANSISANAHAASAYCSSVVSTS